MLMSKLKALPRTYWSLSSLEFLFRSSIAAASYLTVFLQRENFRPDQVGFINAAISIVAIVTTPLWGMLADRIRSIRKILIVCLSVSVVFWILTPSVSRISFGPLPLVYVVLISGALFKNPGYSLFDAFTVQRADLDGLAYGHVRLWGSFSFAVLCFLLSIILPYTGVGFSFYLYGAVLIPLLVILWKMKGADTGRHAGSGNLSGMGFGRLFGDYYFITFLLFAVIAYIPVNTLMVFLPYLIDAVGEDTAKFGLLNAARGLAEIPMLLLMRRLRRKMPLPAIIGGAASIFCVNAFLLAKVTGIYQILLLQAFHGIGGGLMIGSAAYYVYSLAPEGLNSTANSVNGAVAAVSSITGSMLGGFLILNMGVFSYYRIMSAMLFFAILFFGITLIVGIKILKKPLPVLKAF